MRRTFGSEVKRLEEALSDPRDRQAFVSKLIRELAELRITLDKIQSRQELLAEIMGAGSLTEEAPEVVKNEELPTEVVVHADHRLDPAAGFYWLEHGRSGEAFRWTGPDTIFEFYLVVSRANPVLIRIDLLSTIDERNIEEAQCIVDGRMMECAAVRTSTGGFSLECVAPARIRGGPTSVKVYTPYVRAVSGDERAIGVAFSSLRVSPYSGAETPNLASDEADASASSTRPGDASATDPASGRGRSRARARNQA